MSKLKGEKMLMKFEYDFDKDGLVDIIAGSKGENASLTLFLQPDEISKEWKTIKLCNAGWVMSIKLIDMDFDGDEDVLY